MLNKGFDVVARKNGLQDLKSSIVSGNEGERYELLRLIAIDVRASILEYVGYVYRCDVDKEFSICDVLITLFFSVLRFEILGHGFLQCDHLVLDRFNAGAALCAVLEKSGFITIDEVVSFVASPPYLSDHVKGKIPSVEAGGELLGQALLLGIKHSAAARLCDGNWRTFVVLGEEEMQEGRTWEAAATVKYRMLFGLITIINCNWLQRNTGFEETDLLQRLADQWSSFGWDTAEIDGHDFEQLYTTLSAVPGNQPRCIIVYTEKGYGK